MRIALPTEHSPPTTAAQNIQQWIGRHGANIVNAYRVNQQALSDLGAAKGIIEKVLWRLPREHPDLALDTNTMLDLLKSNHLLIEVRKQIRLDAKENKLHAQGFEETRRNLILSRIPEDNPNRQQLAQEIAFWMKYSLPTMRDTKAILQVAQLRLEAGQDLFLLKPPMRATEAQLAAFGKANPGRVYSTEKDELLLLVKPGEKAELTDDGLTLEDSAPAMELD